MKLEIETTFPQAAGKESLFKKTFAEKTGEMLNEGIWAAENNYFSEARLLFERVTEIEPGNETAWLWLASIGEYPEEILAFLGHVLKFNPQNERALGLSAATHSLLADSFVSHGIRALQEDRQEIARHCFLRATSHNPQNETAWMRLSAFAETLAEKKSYLQHVLSINPDHEEALSELAAVNRESLKILVKKANAAAISGEREEALQILTEVSQSAPDLEEVWMLKAYLAEESQDKLVCYEKILELNPDNEAAQAGLASLQALIKKTEEHKPFAEALKEACEANNLSSDISVEEVSENHIAAAEKDFNEEYPASQPLQTENRELFETPNNFSAPENNLLDLEESDVSFDEQLLSEDFPDTIEDSPNSAQNFQSEEESVTKSDADNLSSVSFEEIQPQQNLEDSNEYFPANKNYESDFYEAGISAETPEFIESTEETYEEIFDASEKRPSIMVVDDNPTTLKLVSGKLEKSGYNVIPAIDGREALSKISDFAPDLILLDIAMPKMDGYQVCKMIRNREETKNTPVLMISGKDGIFDESRGKAAGSTGYITKPFGPGSLMRTVETYLNQ